MVLYFLFSDRVKLTEFATLSAVEGSDIIPKPLTQELVPLQLLYTVSLNAAVQMDCSCN